jgi:hypothetical protein
MKKELDIFPFIKQNKFEWINISKMSFFQINLFNNRWFITCSQVNNPSISERFIISEDYEYLEDAAKELFKILERLK